jgi:hypothetical protein
MGGQRVTGADEGAAGASGVSGRVARLVTEIFAPQVLVIGLPPVVGLVSDGWPGLRWGLLASALCGGIPALVIAMGVRAGRLDSRHIVDRSRRTVPLLVAVVAVFAALMLLAGLGAPRLLVATVAAMLAGLAVTIPVTLKWKISFHAAVSAGTVLVLARVLPAMPTIVGGAVVVVVVCWARVRLAHHTVPQVAAGALAGGGSALLTLALSGL